MYIGWFSDRPISIETQKSLFFVTIFRESSFLHSWSDNLLLPIIVLVILLMIEAVNTTVLPFFRSVNLDARGSNQYNYYMRWSQSFIRRPKEFASQTQNSAMESSFKTVSNTLGQKNCWFLKYFNSKRITTQLHIWIRGGKLISFKNLPISFLLSNGILCWKLAPPRTLSVKQVIVLLY